jgi:hypothetical protein
MNETADIAMLARLLLVVAGIVSTTAASGQPALLGLSICKQIKDDNARLKCYDAAMEPTKEQEHSGEPKPTHEWQITEDRAPLDDSPQVSADLMDTDGNAMLIARCKERKTSLIFAVQGTFFGLGGSPVALRFGLTTHRPSASSGTRRAMVLDCFLLPRFRH